MNESEAIPKDWKIVDVSSIGRIETGSTPSKQNASFYNNDYPFYKPTDLQAGYNVRIANDNLSVAGIKQARFLPENSILVTCIGATIGKTGLIRKAGACNQQINAIIPSENVEPAFVYYQVIGPIFQKLIKDNASATTLPILNKTKFQNLPFIIAPIDEQQQIVSKIEELFSEIDKGIEEIKTAQQQLKVYRQAVLKWAFEGKLTNEDVKEGKLPVGWKRVKIEDIATVGTGATPLKGKKEYYQNGTIAWVTSGALNDEFVKEATDYVTEKALKENNLSIYPKHTLLLAMYGEGKTRGKCAELMIEACTNQAIAAISFEKHDIKVKPFLKYYLLKNYNDIRRLSSGGVQPNLNLGIVKKTMLPFPPFEEQQQIVQEIESRLSVCDKIEETITNSLKQAEALRQSILKKAFEGKLV
jgi:type I restriction enzyme, S subunit